MMRLGRQRGGMTLIEVLLAIALLGAGLTALLVASSRCVLALKVARNHQTAHWTLSMGELEYPLVTSNEVEELEVSATTYDNGYTFERSVEEADEEDEEDGLYIIRTRITWAERGGESFEEVVQYVYQPEEE